MADYPWPQYSLTPSKEHLYVLGVISLNFNLYEYSLIVLLEEYLPKAVAAFLTDKLSNVERSRLIQLMVENDKNCDQPLADAVEFILKHFATCADNRHTLMHSRPAIPSMATFGQREQLLELEKFKRGDPDKLLTFRLEIADLRRAADEMRAGFNFMIDLWRYLFDRQHHHTVLERSVADGIPEEYVAQNLAWPTLPKTPPEPRRIDPHPIYEVG